MVIIEDTGVGIPADNLEKVFDAFFTTKDEVKGVGLGLSICHGFINEHGGRIDVASEVGKGAIFTIYLPAKAGDD
jgi:two-component system NtrC family sensor kinase